MCEIWLLHDKVPDNTVYLSNLERAGEISKSNFDLKINVKRLGFLALKKRFPFAKILLLLSFTTSFSTHCN